jgi:mannose-6-phosphate isomerase-like protein (cupin superfamily)
MRHDEQPAIERFNTALDHSMTSGDRSPISGDDLDLIAAHDRVRALDALLAPNRDFVNRLKEDLMHAATMTAVNRSPGSFNSFVEQPRIPVFAGAKSIGGRRFKPQFAPRLLLAALVLLALGGGWIGYQTGLPGRGGGPASNPNFAAAGTAIPAVTPPGERTLAEYDIPASALTPGIAGSSTAHFVIPAASTSTWTYPEEAEVHYVLEGDLSLTSDKPIDVRRAASNGKTETIPAGTAVDIGVGDSVLLGSSAVTTFVNTASTPVVLFSWGMDAGSNGSPPFPASWNPVVYGLSGDGAVTVPAGGAHIRLWTIELKKHETIAAPKDQIIQLGYDADQFAAGKWSSAQAVIRMNDGSMMNITGTTVTVYIATLTSTGGTAGTPVATP